MVLSCFTFFVVDKNNLNFFPFFYPDKYCLFISIVFYPCLGYVFSNYLLSFSRFAFSYRRATLPMTVADYRELSNFEGNNNR